MTVTPIHTRKPRKRVLCPHCRIPTGNLDQHSRYCTEPANQEAARLALLAGLHAASPVTLAPAARFRPPIDDLAVARLMRALEAGTLVTRGGTMGWTTPGSRNLLRGDLAVTVAECLRTGLVVLTTLSAGPVRFDLVLPGPVHARSSADPRWPACRDTTALRHRLIGGDLIRHVTCEACLDVPLSAVSYSTNE